MVVALQTFRLEEEDRLLFRMALQTVGIMQSTGNYKKSVKSEDLLESIYRPLISDEKDVKQKREVSDDPEYAKEFVKQLEQKIQAQ